MANSNWGDTQVPVNSADTEPDVEDIVLDDAELLWNYYEVIDFEIEGNDSISIDVRYPDGTTNVLVIVKPGE